MSRGTAKACITCGKVQTHGSRCADCQALWDAAQERRHHNPVYDEAAWRALRDRILTAWVKAHGYLCPGDEELGQKPHLTRDLTVDHRVPLAEGGALLDPANTRVRCRSCNGRLGNLRRRAWTRSDASTRTPPSAGPATGSTISPARKRRSRGRATSVSVTRGPT
jgi:5-methylcytosine-specific restriction endonuclease McrA